MTGVRRRLAIAGLTLSIATASKGSDEAASESLAGTDWTLIGASLDVVVPDQITVTVSFSDDTISGSSGCNQYTGSYTLGQDGALTIGRLATTRMACVPDVGAVEASVLGRLGAVTAVEQVDDELRLLDADGSVVLRFDSAP